MNSDEKLYCILHNFQINKITKKSEKSSTKIEKNIEKIVFVQKSDKLLKIFLEKRTVIGKNCCYFNFILKQKIVYFFHSFF